MFVSARKKISRVDFGTDGPENLKSPGKKNLVKSNESFFPPRNCISSSFLNFFQFKNRFFAIFEIAKNGIWSKKIFVKLNLFDFKIFLAWTF